MGDAGYPPSLTGVQRVEQPAQWVPSNLTISQGGLPNATMIAAAEPGRMYTMQSGRPAAGAVGGNLPPGTFVTAVTSGADGALVQPQLMMVEPGKGVDGQERQVCTFFLRTGTCAYGDRCKFKHPHDRPPPQLNSRGYPVRACEQDCAHYIKKGWCAFGLTCKFNHPELAPGMPFAMQQQQPAVIQQYPSNVYSAVPVAYYVPPVQQVPSQVSAYSLPSAQTAFGGPVGGVGYPGSGSGAMASSGGAVFAAQDNSARLDQLTRCA